VQAVKQRELEYFQQERPVINGAAASLPAASIRSTDPVEVPHTLPLVPQASSLTIAEEKARLTQLYAMPNLSASASSTQNGARSVSAASSGFSDERALYEAAIQARNSRAASPPPPRTVDSETPQLIDTVVQEKARLKQKYGGGPQTNGSSSASDIPVALLDQPTLLSVAEEKAALRKKYDQQDSGLSTANSR
jgi:transposase-like protein